MFDVVKSITPSFLKPTLINIFFKVTGIVFRGGSYYCPCCENKVRLFLPHSTYKKKARAKTMCPVCGSNTRQRLIWLFIKNQTPWLKDYVNIIHFAPEFIIQKKLKEAKNVTYVSADIDSPIAMERIDIQNIQYPNSSFDGLICLHVLAHVKDDAKAISELYRVLKPGGIGIIQTTVRNDIPKTIEYENLDTKSQRLEKFGQSDLYRIYGADLQDRIAKAGFNVERVKYAPQIGDETVIEQYGLIQNETFFLCKKPSS